MKTKSISGAVKELLLLNFSTYRKLVKKNRKNPSSIKIHNLRIQINTFLAALEIGASLESKSATNKLCKNLNEIRKKTSNLRDLHVEIELLKHKEKKHFRSFKKFLIKRKLKFAKRTKLVLAKVPLKSQARAIHLLAKNLRTLEHKKNQMDATKKIDNYIQKVNHSFKGAQWPKNSADPKGLHAVRRKVKKLYYLGELQNTILGKSEVNLKYLKKIKKSLGQIQNDRALIKTIDKYLEGNGHRKNTGVQKLKKLTYTNQKHLIHSIKC